MAQVTESDYKIAQQGDARVRQEFLDAIDLESVREFISSVNYDTNNKNFMSVRGNFGYAFNLPIFSFMRISISCGITVGGKAFEQLSFPFFLNCLKFHEGLHAEQYVKRRDIFKKIVHNSNISFLNQDFWHSIFEIPAYANQIATQNNFTAEEEDCIKNFYQSYSKLFNFPYKYKEKRKLLEGILLNSPGDVLVRADFNLN